MNLSAYEDFSETLKALAHPVRLRIAVALLENECTVSLLCNELNLPQSTISQHISILKNRGIVVGRRNGTKIAYHITSEVIYNFLEMIQESFAQFSRKRRSTSQRSFPRA